MRTHPSLQTGGGSSCGSGRDLSWLVELDGDPYPAHVSSLDVSDLCLLQFLLLKGTECSLGQL